MASEAPTLPIPVPLPPFTSGGGALLSDLINVPITPNRLPTAVVALTVDLSKVCVCLRLLPPNKHPPCGLLAVRSPRTHDAIIPAVSLLRLRYDRFSVSVEAHSSPYASPPPPSPPSAP